MSDDILEAWRVNCHMNYLLFDAIPAKALEARYSPKWKTMTRQAPLRRQVYLRRQYRSF